MSDEVEKIPIDARLLSDAIIELNISRRNVAVYPKDHPSVEKSLSRAYEFLKKLFELRPEITLAVAKDTLIIDDYYLDKKNPVYREFALHLNKMNIAYVTFITGLTKDELYEFHKLISERVTEMTPEAFQERFRGLNLIHIKAGFIDYGAFFFEEGKTAKDLPDVPLWERYAYGLIEGTLQTEDMSDDMKDIPPDVLARFLNRTSHDNLKEETYDKVITTYIRRSSETAFSSKDLKRLMDFINSLRPELKKQFLTSSVRTVSKDIDSAYKMLKETPIEELMELLSAINEQKVAIPEELKNLMDKLSRLPQDGMENVAVGGGLVVDDIFLSPDIINLFGEGSFEKFITDTYQKEIQKLLNFDASGVIVSEISEMKREYDDDYIEQDFNYAILELLSSHILNEEEYKTFTGILREQIDPFLWTSQYARVLQALKVLEQNNNEQKFPEMTSELLQYYHSSEFIAKIIDSLRTVGRQMREEAAVFCEYYGEKIIPALLDALIDENSQIVRKFLMSLLIRFKDKMIPEALRRLNDSRWFVKRNMIYLLCESKREDVLPYIKLYCRHENRKVSIEAIKCLLVAGDSYGIEAIKDSLRSDSKELVEQATALAGSFRIREVVPDLIQMLKKRGISGADLYDKIPVVKALGEIGDPRALDILKYLLSEKSIIFKGVAEKLKEEIYRTLKNYPYENIQDFIKAGLRSKNEYIREVSSRLSKVQEK
jgi:hypothetical protein